MFSKPSVAAVLKAAAELPRVEQTVEYLHKFDSFALREVLRMMFDPTVKFHKDLPSGKTPYHPSKFDEPGRLYSEVRRFYLFIQDDPKCPYLKPIKRQQLWIQLLESISPDDAELLDFMKDKKSPWSRISRHTTKKAYPELFDN